jgi:iron complex outermembrane recepter protein
MWNNRTQDRSVSLAAAVSLTLLSAQLYAQEGAPRRDVEEVVVTGSYIKRDRFEAVSPTEVIGVEDLLTSGAPNIGHVVRDLTFTENTDTVANVLGTQDGQQDSNSARFNIRGLGVGSTLTLFDSRRTVDTGALGSLIPELATERIEVVLDGGAALYGADAVAGVVNVIPVKKFDGYKMRAFYTQDEGGDFNEPKFSVLAGKSFEKLDLVGALDYSKKTALRRGERPRYLRADDDDSGTGNPGAYQVVNANGTFGTTSRDRDCAQYNQGNMDDGLPGGFPSGVRSTGTTCIFEFGEFQDYGRPAEEWDSYASAVYAVNDNLNIELQVNATWRTSTLISSPTTANSGNNEELRIPVSNPGNYLGAVLRPSTFGWRPFTKGPGASHFSEGAASTDFDYLTDRYKLGSTYNFGDTSWSGETWVSLQTSRREVDGHALLFDRLQAALNGRGGPNGNLYWNPFGSADPRSPNYRAGVTNNSQEVIDWMFVPEQWEDTRDRLRFVETVVTGDVFNLPAGAVALAVGGQVRDATHVDRPGPQAQARNDYNTSVTDDPADTLRTDSQVNAAFLELNVPVFASLSLQAAVRHEDFRDLELSATTPKFALRYQPFESLALRASYGEGFLAPMPEDVQAVENRGCAEVFTGTDPFTGTTLGGTRSCLSGNPALKPESSEIVNIGFTWAPIDDLEVSLDYQLIEYVDRIQTLASQDLVNRDFANFLTANNLANAAAYNALSAAQRTSLSNAWFATSSDPLIERDAATQNRVREVTRVPDNLSGNEIEAYDLRVRYGFDVGSIGTFSASLSTTYYDRYEYTGFSGEVVDAVGRRNGDTTLAPPISQWKHALRLGWYLGNHSATVSAKYSDALSFDGTVDVITAPAVADGLPPAIAAPRTISSWQTYDIRYQYEFESLWGGRASLALGAINAFNEQADPLPVSGGFESRVQDPYGRQFFFEMNYEF